MTVGELITLLEDFSSKEEVTLAMDNTAHAPIGGVMQHRGLGIVILVSKAFVDSIKVPDKVT